MPWMEAIQAGAKSRQTKGLSPRKAESHCLLVIASATPGGWWVPRHVGGDWYEIDQGRARTRLPRSAAVARMDCLTFRPVCRGFEIRRVVRGRDQTTF